MKLSIILTIFLYISCQTEQQIQVDVKPQPIQFNLSVPIDPMEVQDQFSEIEEVDVIGGVFGELAEMMANAEIEEGDLGNFAFTPCLYEIEELESLNFDFVKSIELKSIKIQLDSDDPSADFSFVEFAHGHIKVLTKEEFDFLQQDFQLCSNMSSEEKQPETTQSDEEIDYWNLDTSDMELAFSYHKNTEEIGNIIYPEIHLRKWRDLLAKNNHLLLFFKVKIDKAPDYEFHVSGNINLNIDIDLKSN